MSQTNGTGIMRQAQADYPNPTVVSMAESLSALSELPQDDSLAARFKPAASSSDLWQQPGIFGALSRFFAGVAAMVYGLFMLFINAFLQM